MPDVALTLPEIIIQLQTQWGGDDEGDIRAWLDTTLEYSLIEIPVPLLFDEWEGITAMTVKQEAFITDAFEMWDDLIAISLTPLAKNVSAQITVAYSSTTDDGGTYASPTQALGVISEQELWLSANPATWPELQDANLVYGARGLYTFLHEIGHALGLSHPGTYNAGDGSTYENSAEYFQDTLQYTLMSYWPANSFNLATNHLGSFAATPLLHDIAAIQAKYGADFTTRAGDTVYGFNSTAGRTAFNFNVNKNPVIAIWDGGGIDTLDCSGFAQNQLIDLRSGFYSNIGALTNNVAIAYNCVIENAIGGIGADNLQGNTTDNRLEGGAGSDTILGESGNDVLIGGGGVDNLFGNEGNDTLTGGDGGDLLNGGAGFDTAAYTSPLGETVFITPVGNPANGRWEVKGPAQATGDILAQIEGFVFGNGNDRITLINAPGFQTIAINGGGGNDFIFGNADHENMIGGAGTDEFFPGLGSFSVSGGTPGPTAGSWIESIDENDLLVLDRRTFGASYSFIDYGLTLTGFWLGTDGSTARGIARLQYLGSGFTDVVYGAQGDDIIRGFDGNDALTGRSGNDELNGGNGLDQISGGLGDDLLIGGEGNDNLDGGDGNDILRGGLGLDSLVGGSGNDRLETGGGGDITVLGQGGDDTIDGAEDIESLYGGDGNDWIYAYGGNDTLLGGDGNDTMFGGAGNDLIFSGLGIEFINGGANFDTLSIDRSSTALGVTFALKGAVASTGSDGTSVVNVEVLNYTGGSGNDKITGFDYDDILLGNGGDDRLNGGAGVDVLYGGIGNDVLIGGLGSNNLLGEDGNDILRGGPGVDGLVGGIGNDTIYTGGGGDVTVLGQDGDDTLIGSNDNEFFNGGNDQDRIVAKGGNDRLSGDAGNDTLLGGLGNDILIGGLGNDFFVFSAGLGSDEVTDFDSDAAGGQDAIDVTAFNYAGFAAMLADGVTILASGVNTVITFGVDRPVVTLSNIAVGSIDGSDFLI